MLDGWVFQKSTVLWMLVHGELVLVTVTIGGSGAPGRFQLVSPRHLDASSHDLSNAYHKRKLVKFHVEPDFRPYFNRGKVRCWILTAPLLFEVTSRQMMSFDVM